LRPGGISRDRLIQVMAVEPAADSEILSKACAMPPPRVSGALQSHYAPNARVMLLNSEECELGLQQLRAASPASSIGCLLIEPLKREPSGQGITVVVMPSDAQRYAHDLYARLHDLDQLGCRVIVVERPPQSIEWEAVQDRLKRAAADRTNPDHAQ
jgi:L-threonylcarbamoyladenylate synthase